LKTFFSSLLKYLPRGKGEIVVLLVGSFMIILVLGVSYGASALNSDINRQIGPSSPTYAWIDRSFHPESQNVHDMAQSLLRLRSGIILFADGRMAKGEYEALVFSLQGKISQYGQGTVLRDELSQFASFNPSLIEVGRFIDTSKALPYNKQLLQSALNQSGVAIDQWSLLQRDALTYEHEMRQILRDAVVKRKYTLQNAAAAAVALLILSLLTIVTTMVLALKYLKEVKSRKETIERLVASVGHDLRSPLQSINSAAALLNLSDSEERRKISLSVIRSSISTLSRLVDDIVQIVRQEKLDYRQRPMNIVEWFDEFCATYSAKALAKNLKWDAKRSLEFAFIEADPDRLSQCFGNLVDNAIKFSDKGTISINLAIDGLKGSDVSTCELVFTVSDEGIGIRSEDLRVVFRPFVRSSVDSNRSGMGLGLSIVSTILEAQGGRVEVKSTLGVGSTFTARIPVQTKLSSNVAVPAKHPIISNSPRGATSLRKSILLVDDDPNIRSSLGAVLEEYGFNVETAGNGREALEMLQETPLKVVVSDIQMPIMDGFELASKCRGLTNPPFFIAQTAYTTDLAKHKDSVYFDVCLSKPIDELELVSQINRGLAAPGRHQSTN
jgi:signal transduction histidine kinase